MNKTFDHFQCFSLIPRQDRPHKVYISLKLRAFAMYSQQVKRIQAHFELQLVIKSQPGNCIKVTFPVVFETKVSCILKWAEPS